MTREELRDYVDEQRGLGNIPYPVYSTLIDGIDTLEQEPNTGHWTIYDVHGHKACKCSECDNDVGYPCTDKYCKYCGTKMGGG